MSSSRRNAGRAALATVVAIVAAACTADLARAAVQADFDGDGYDDLAVGAPGDSVRGQGSAGAVNVLYGSRNGLHADGDQQFTKALPGLGTAEAGARFGAGLAAGRRRRRRLRRPRGRRARARACPGCRRRPREAS